MDVLLIGPTTPKTLSARGGQVPMLVPAMFAGGPASLEASPGRCTPLEKVMVDCVTSCEWRADRKGRFATIARTSSGIG
jgi:hypothetical protein